MNAKERSQTLLAPAGIEINGSNPWDIQVHNDDFYFKAFRYGTLGVGESYMDGDWTAGAVDQFVARVCGLDLQNQVGSALAQLPFRLANRIFNRQSAKKAEEVARRHYNPHQDIYRAMLGPNWQYTNCYWENEDGTLTEAEVAKLHMICRKLGIRPGDKVLEIGSGWGGFARFAAENYHAEVVGISISTEQNAFAEDFCKMLPVQIAYMDYRKLVGRQEWFQQFDKVVSIGMMEHVGYKNYDALFDAIRWCLKPEGLALIQVIGSRTSEKEGEPWMDRYIFCNGMLPSVAQIGKAIERRFVMEDWINIGAHYDRTLMAWNENFQASWNTLADNYDERFKRMWEYYLLSCAGSFRARIMQSWQVVLSPKGVRGGYQPVR